MRRWIIDVVLFGERPEVARVRRQDWLTYLDEFAGNHGSFAALVETIRGAISHVSWRVTASKEQTTIPVSIAIGIAAPCSILFPLTNPDSGLHRWAADVHLGIALAIVATILLGKPWEVRFSRRLSASFFFVGTGFLHVAYAPYDSPIWAYHRIALVIVGVSLFVLAGASFRSGKPFGKTILPSAFAAASVGAVVAVQAWALVISPSVGVAIAAAGFAVAAYFFAMGFLGLRKLEPTAHVASG